jgi:hypothetical protein
LARWGWRLVGTGPALGAQPRDLVDQVGIEVLQVAGLSGEAVDLLPEERHHGGGVCIPAVGHQGRETGDLLLRVGQVAR